MRRLLGSPALGAAVFAAGLLLAWQVLVDQKLISPVFFPSPSRTLEELWDQVASGRLWDPLAATTLRMFYGFALASLLGVVLGAAIGSSRTAREFLAPLLELMRPLPASAIIPPAILFFGLSAKMATIVIAFGAIWPVLLASVHGFANVERLLQDLCAALRLSRRDYLLKVAFPSAMPDILAGARVSLAIALILAVVTEMQASQPGLGQNILLAQRTYRSPELYAGVVTLGILGFLINRLLLLIERRVLRWQAAQQ
ncbi:MAG: ABC transporter permease [Betaproteobacteria bacterium RIFCSPLOWO2_02_FULL_65_24]|nr:MAG: ABC transporter permease [Betaproteobacteria bacterium RIFCSPLOWO2_02_FULL_65_24]